MKASKRYLALLGLGLTTLALARPEEAWRDVQRGGDGSGGRAAQAPAPAPRNAPGAPQGGRPESGPSRGFGGNPGNGTANGGGNWRNDNRGAVRPDSRGAGRNDGWRGNTDQWRGNTQRNDGWRGNTDQWRGNTQRNDGWRGNNDGWRRDDDRRYSWSTDRGRNYYDRHRFDGFRQQNFRYYSGRHYARTRYRLGSFYWPHGYGSRVWLIGEWLPTAFYYDDGYYLRSYWSYGLYTPPFGCRWVRVGDNALLVDEFSGEILDAVYDLFW